MYKSLEIIRRFTMGKEARENEYCKEEERSKCRLCEKEAETMEHVLQNCKVTEQEQENGRGFKMEIKRV